MFKKMQWKIVLVYSLLSLLAMQFFGVYLMQSLESYYLNNYLSSLETQGTLLANFLERHLANEEEENVASLVMDFSSQSGTEIMVLDSYGRVISSSEEASFLEGRRILQDEVSMALSGNASNTLRVAPDTNIKQQYLALPVSTGGNVLGVVYITASLESIDETIREVQFIFLGGTLIVIGITVVLGFILANTITRPIQELTNKAGKMAKGDFSQRIKIKSKDEIGKLGEMFNHLTLRLDETLKEMSSEKSKVEAILNYMTDGIIAFDNKGQMVQLNPAAIEMLQIDISKETPQGEKILPRLLSNEERENLFPLAKQEGIEVEFKEIGNKFINIHLAPFKAKEGDFKGILLVLHDVTKERELTRAQQEFVANVSHELRTPITTIKSYVETLLEGALDNKEVSNNFLHIVQKETERMVRLVKDLLVLSRIDYQQLSWTKEYHNFDRLVEEVFQEMSVKYFKDSPRLEINLASKDLYFNFDRDKIKQVLLNLLSNAYSFTPESGSITLKVKKDTASIVVSVSDTGVGIPDEEKEKVFNRFYRVDKTRSRESGGTGLGLSIAKQLVEAHGGDIYLESMAGQGTTVTFTLPYSKSDEREGEDKIAGNY